MDEALFTCVMLASRGFGTVEQIMGAPSNHVIAMLDYVRYKDDLERTTIQLNREK